MGPLSTRIDGHQWFRVDPGPFWLGKQVPDAWGFFLVELRGGGPFSAASQVQVLWVEHD